MVIGVYDFLQHWSGLQLRSNGGYDPIPAFWHNWCMKQTPVVIQLVKQAEEIAANHRARESSTGRAQGVALQGSL